MGKYQQEGIETYVGNTGISETAAFEVEK